MTPTVPDTQRKPSRRKALAGLVVAQDDGLAMPTAITFADTARRLTLRFDRIADVRAWAHRAALEVIVVHQDPQHMEKLAACGSGEWLGWRLSCLADETVPIDQAHTALVGAL